MSSQVLLVKETSYYDGWNLHKPRITQSVHACLAGYMCSPCVLDKDGVSAAAIAGEMITYLASTKTSLSQQLTNIYEE